MRLFVAVPVPTPLRLALNQSLGPWRSKYPHLKWVESSHYHFTLQFLGDVMPGQLPALKESLQGLQIKSGFTLETGAAFAMPPGARARVLALGLRSGVKNLGELAECVHRVTEPLGFEPERRGFKAHLTLARVRRGDELLLDPDDIGTPHLPNLRVDAFHLYESELAAKGPIYRSLLEVRFSDG
ncbi:RNA 2',3'-cyclic phosphodiesterase [bacterium]|nr:RNA 2',3'-cyclic phosphodiesterase [bacterium]